MNRAGELVQYRNLALMRRIHRETEGEGHRELEHDKTRSSLGYLRVVIMAIASQLGEGEKFEVYRVGRTHISLSIVEIEG
jgi:hypothetical protein